MMATFDRAWILCLATALHGASIHGTVVENQTGYPIARATVTLESAARGVEPLTARTNVSGIFEFPGLPAGTYRLSAAKLAFAPVRYGQKTWYSPGMPITLTEGDSADLTIRMPRFGAISGTVLDENDVGLPEHDVAVYSNTRPPRLIGRARTDDRGVYRLAELRPGSYLVRSLSKDYDDESYLPTFYRDSPSAQQAHAIEVKLDQEIEQMDFHPAAGRLFTVSGRVNTAFGTAEVTLTSDAGTETANIDGRGNLTFRPMAPGDYDLLAVIPADRSHGRSAWFQTLTVDRDVSSLNVSPVALPTVQFAFQDPDGRPVVLPGASLMIRRQDPAAESTPETVGSSLKLSLIPGRWEVAIRPDDSYCAIDFEPARSAGRADGWNEMLLPSGSQTVVKFVLSSSTATVAGTVKNQNGDAVPNVPIFLEPYDIEPRRQLEPLRSVTADARGRYQIGGLCPGAYRLLASFDYQSPEPRQMEAAGAKTIRIERGQHANLDLAEFIIH